MSGAGADLATHINIRLAPQGALPASTAKRCLGRHEVTWNLLQGRFGSWQMPAQALEHMLCSFKQILCPSVVSQTCPDLVDFILIGQAQALHERKTLVVRSPDMHKLWNDCCNHTQLAKCKRARARENSVCCTPGRWATFQSTAQSKSSPSPLVFAAASSASTARSLTAKPGSRGARQSKRADCFRALARLRLRCKLR